MKKITFSSGIEVEVERMDYGLQVRLAIPEALRQRVVRDVTSFTRASGFMPHPIARAFMTGLRQVVDVAAEVGEEPKP